MDVRGWELLSALLIQTRLIIVFGIYTCTITVGRAGKHGDEDIENDDKEESKDSCESECNYGCCEDSECCESPSSLPSYAVQMMAVVGAFVVTLLLLCLCIMRYRMASKFRNARALRHRARSMEAGRASSTAVSNCASEDSAMSTFPPYRMCFQNSLRTLMLLEIARLSSSSLNTLGVSQLVSPPPYTEHDSQALNFGSSGQLPPAYEDVVKASDPAPPSLPSASASASASASSPAEQTRD